MKASRKYVKALKKDVNSKEGLVNASKFVAVFIVTFLVFLYLVIPLTGAFWDGLGIFHAQFVGNLLSWSGIESQVSGNILTMDVQGQGVDFEISRLCSGDIEIALLVSLLIASLDVLIIWRILGAIIGTITLIILNPLRVFVTLLITKDSGMDVGDFYHSIIFRLFLFVVLVLYYFIWYRAFAKRKSKFQKKICKKFKC